MVPLRTGTVARRADHARHERHGPFNSERRLGKVKVESDSNIPSPLGTATDPAEATPERPAEELLEDVLDSAELAEQILSSKGLAAIVRGTFLRIRKHFVGFGDLSEPIFSLLVARVRIRMCLSCECTKRLLDLVGTRSALHSERAVVILHSSAPMLLWRPSDTRSMTRIVRL